MGVMTATTKVASPVQAPSVPAPKTKNVFRKGAKTQRKTQRTPHLESGRLCAVAPLRENPSTRVSVTFNKSQPRNAIIQTVQALPDIAPPTITLGRPASHVFKDQTLKKLESTTSTG